MATPGSAPKAVIVFDVNVLIDAANPQSHQHVAAVRALSDNNDMPIYFSDTMLKTTANKLLEMGADPVVVDEYIELIMNEDDYGPEKHVIEHVPVTDYGLLDKYGKPDYEDSTIVSLMDAAEDRAGCMAILVSSDGALREWCGENQRMAVRPDRLPKISAHMADDVRHATYQYTSRRMFRPDAQKLPAGETKAHAKQLVSDIRKTLKAEPHQMAPTEDRYQRFPELRPTEATEPIDTEAEFAQP